MRKTVLVTGASGGIGGACARFFAAEGYKVAIHYNSDKTSADTLRAEICSSGGEAICVCADLADEGQVADMLCTVERELGEVDVLVNDVYTAAKDAGIIDETLFIVIADHGGTNPGNGQGGGHGGWTDGEKYVTFAATGKGVNKVHPERMNIRDLAAIVLYSFGIDLPEFDEAGWTSQIPEGLFNDSAIPSYRDISHLTGAAPRISRVPHTSELI